MIGLLRLGEILGLFGVAGAAPNSAAPEPPQTPAFANAADASDDVVLLGEEAARILEHPVLALAFDRVDRGLLDRIRNSTPLDTAGREEAYRLHWAVQQLKSELRQMAGNAKMKRSRAAP